MFGNGKSAREYLEEEYTAALKEKEEKLKLTLTPAQMREKERQDNIFKDTEELLSLNILNPDIVSSYRELNKKLKDKKAEIEKLYGTDVSPESLEIIRSVYDKLRSGYEQEIKDCRDRFEKDIRDIRSGAEALKAEKSSLADAETGRIEKETEDLKQKLERDFEREKVEYEYSKQRERKIEQEKRDYEVKKRKEDLSLREAEVRERKNESRKKLDEIMEMQSNVDDIPALIERAHSEGAKEREAELTKRNAFKAEVEKKEQDNRIHALKEEYNRLFKKYTELSDETMELNNRLDQCNAESRRLTGDTVRYIGGINILNSDAHQHNDVSSKK